MEANVIKSSCTGIVSPVLSGQKQSCAHLVLLHADRFSSLYLLMSSWTTVGLQTLTAMSCVASHALTKASAISLMAWLLPFLCHSAVSRHSPCCNSAQCQHECATGEASFAQHALNTVQGICERPVHQVCEPIWAWHGCVLVWLC